MEFVRPGERADAVDDIVPRWVIRPGTVEEVQACVRAAAASGATVVPSGRGAHLDIGAPPTRVEVLLRLDRLARVVDHQAADMTITMEAGCSLAEVDVQLGQAGQWLPLDPPRPETTTVGGTIAANLSGPLRASQGTVRDLLLGLRVVAADGAVVVGGGRVVKNVAGYDLPKLHVGALGTLGVIVAATFKVRPRPAREEAVTIPCRSLAAAAAVALAVLDGPVAPLWIELASDLEGTPGVAVGLGGIDAEVAYGRQTLGAIAARCGGTMRSVVDGRTLRGQCADFAVQPAAAVLRAATVPARVGEIMDAFTTHARRAGVGVRMMAHAANGVVRVAVADAAHVTGFLDELRPVLARDGGALVVERAAGGVKRPLDPWGDPGPGLALMRRLKASFDPGSVLAPGRFVGGL